jgi:phosphatidyl-myo-inositol alpha-mannosyltransferase
MKIAIVASYLPEKSKKTGGVSVAIHRLATELSSMDDHTVTVFSIVGHPENATYTYQELFPKLKKIRNKKLFILYILPTLLNWFDFSKFDIVHLHGDDWFYVYRKTPSIRTLHGSALYEARAAKTLKRKLLQYSIYPLEKMSSYLATLSIAVGPDSQSIYKTDRLIGNGVNISQFSCRGKTEFPSIIFIGTWKGRKRGEFLHQIFVDQVLPQIPDARLYVISDTWEDHPNVTSISFPDDQALAEILSKAWVFTYPSTYEGFGIPYIEALASGTAIISSPNVGADFVLSGGQYGIIEEDESFGDAIIELLKNHERRDQMTQKGLARAAEFSWEQICQQHIEAYREAIQKFGA